MGPCGSGRTLVFIIIGHILQYVSMCGKHVCCSLKLIILQIFCLYKLEFEFIVKVKIQVEFSEITFTQVKFEALIPQVTVAVKGIKIKKVLLA